MKPGQLTPNEFELAILARLASKAEALRPLIPHLHVLSREFTGVGSFTNFKADPSRSSAELGDSQLGLEEHIALPEVPHGMGAVLICTDGCPAVLETFTYGDDLWDGTFVGFKLERLGE